MNRGPRAAHQDPPELPRAGSPRRLQGGPLRELAAHLGVPLERVIAVGDHENDVEMLLTSGLGVAVPDAPESVRVAADRVAPTVAEGGLLAQFREVLPDHFA